MSFSDSRSFEDREPSLHEFLDALYMRAGRQAASGFFESFIESCQKISEERSDLQLCSEDELPVLFDFTTKLFENLIMLTETHLETLKACDEKAKFIIKQLTALYMHSLLRQDEVLDREKPEHLAFFIALHHMDFNGSMDTKFSQDEENENDPTAALTRKGGSLHLTICFCILLEILEPGDLATYIKKLGPVKGKPTEAPSKMTWLRETLSLFKTIEKDMCQSDVKSLAMLETVSEFTRAMNAIHDGQPAKVLLSEELVKDLLPKTVPANIRIMRLRDHEEGENPPPPVAEPS